MKSASIVTRILCLRPPNVGLLGRQKLEEFQKANQTVAEANCRPLKTLGPDRGEDNVESASEAAVSPSKYNVLVSSGTLIPSLVKCLLFRLNSHFHHENSKSYDYASLLICVAEMPWKMDRGPVWGLVCNHMPNSLSTFYIFHYTQNQELMESFGSTICSRVTCMTKVMVLYLVIELYDDLLHWFQINLD